MEYIRMILMGAFVIVAVLMTFLILLQEGKGGGLAALGGTKAASVEGVTNPIRRATAYLAGIWFLLAVLLGAMASSGGSQVADDLYKNEAEESKKKEDDHTQTPAAGGASEKMDGVAGIEVEEEKEASAAEKKDAVGDVKPAEKKEAPVVEGAKAGEMEKKPGGAAPDEAVRKEEGPPLKSVDGAAKKVEDATKKVE